MPLRRERIDIEMETAVYAYMNRGEHSADPAEQAAWMERHQKVLAFRKRYLFKNYSRKDAYGNAVIPQARHITYDMLPDVFSMAELDGIGLYNLVGILVPWPSELLGSIAEACRKMDAITLERVCESALALSNDWWRNPEVMEKTPSLKIYAFMRHQTLRLRQEDLPLPSWLQRAWEDRHQTTGIETVHLPKASTLLKVSMHWLLGLPADTGFYGENPKIDLILDAASFMTESTQHIFLDALRTMGGAQHEY
jgi:hypothetical protein